MSVGDDAGGQGEERFVNVVAAFPADAQAFHAVVPRDRALDDPSEHAQAGAVRLATAADVRADSLAPQRPPVLVVVVAAVAVQPRGAPARASAPSRYGGDRLHQRQQLGDVIAVAAGQ